jgi:YVTN family beta-propeller protein
MRFARLLLLGPVAGFLCSQTAPREQVGRMPDGSFMLPTGWRIKPMGEQVPLDTLPMSSAVSRDGKFVLVLNGGYNPPSISVLAADTMKETARVPIGDGWLGLTFSPDGRFVYVGGGASYRVREFSWSSSGDLKPAREFEISPGQKPGERDFIGDVTMSPDGRLIYAADLYHDGVAVINPQSGRVIEKFKTGRRPYRILFHPDGKSFFVSSWADSTVYQYDSQNGNEVSRIRLAPHATDMVLSNRKPDRDADADEKDSGAKYRLFVAAGNTNSVFVVGVQEDKDMKLLETLNVAMTPQEPAGMTPSGLALNADQTRLYVACSDANAVAVADVSTPRSRLMGFVPSGWYPTAVRSMADGRLLILNGRGGGSRPSTYVGPKRTTEPLGADGRTPGYIAAQQTGSLSVAAPLTDDSLDEASRQVYSLSPYKDSMLDAAATMPDSVAVSKPGKPSPIQHVIYVIKENRTYDQVFGAIGKGNGDASLTLFDETVAPNHYKLAREFVLFDNFYVNADVSADGHNWSTAAIAPDFTERLWPSNYGKRSPYYGFEGGEPANTPPAGYLWTNAISAGLAVRNYGEFVENRKKPTDARQVERVTDPSLASITNMNYRGFDTDYPDVERIKVFLEDLKAWEASGTMPRLMIVRLGNDHTAGTTPKKLTPQAMFADNDYALGMLAEAVSKSRFWGQTAIFAIEDDAQNGPDHVDSHRSVMLALSPYTHRGTIDSSMYNQASVMRTMELILGLKPMTHFDAAARPLNAAFVNAPNAAPFVAERPRISLDQRNPENSATAARSAKLDFSDADRIDDDELNDILWRAIKGTEPPPPVRSLFAR